MKYFVWLALLVSVSSGCDRRAPPGARTQKATTAVSAVSTNTSGGVAAPGSASPGTATTSPTPSHVLPKATGSYRELTWTFEDTRVGEMRVVVVIPSHASASHRLPVVLTMHGQGEALKGPKKGARGWVDDYWLPKALRRLHAPPLTPGDFLNRFDHARLAGFNQQLERNPYRGLIVVCPYTPYRVLKGDRAFSDAHLLADFLVDEVIPKVYAQTPAVGTPATTGLDGVSLGGRASVLVGLARPEAFGALGALQPAFDVEDAPRLARRAKAARAKNPHLAIRLLTSEGDYYLASTKAISKEMSQAGVDNTLEVVPGDHSYDFNRGPGVYEMLLFHDRALRGQR